MTGSVCGGRHTRAEVSHPAETSRLPSGLQASAGTRSVWLTSSHTCLCVISSHTRTTRSSPAVATKSPRGENAIAETGNGFGHALISPTNFCVAASQNRTMPSSWPLASVRPSALNAIAVTHDVCSIRFTSWPVATSQRIRSSLPLASNFAPGLKHPERFQVAKGSAGREPCRPPTSAGAARRRRSTRACRRPRTRRRPRRRRCGTAARRISCEPAVAAGSLRRWAYE